MAEEEDEELLREKKKKEKEKDLGPELAPGDVVNPIEYKMFDKTNMLKTLNIPGKQAYNFQKELAGTIEKRLEAIRLRLGADDVDPVAEMETMEIIAGLQHWEKVDPVSGQLIELNDAILARKLAKEPKIPKTGKEAAAPVVAQITPSVMTRMRGALPIPKQEDKKAMPAANRRMVATATKFEGLFKAKEKPEYGDYYETIEKWNREYKGVIGKRPSEMKTEEKLDVQPKDLKKGSMAQNQKTSSFFKGDKGDAPTSARTSSWTAPGGLIPTVTVPAVKKVKTIKKPPGMPEFLDGVINYFLANVSPDCDLEAWLTPSNIVPVFKIRDIPPEIEHFIVTIATITHGKFIDDQVIAAQIRSALEIHHGYACKWHVVVGRQFGLQVNADKNNFLFMYIGHIGYVVFRTFG